MIVLAIDPDTQASGLALADAKRIYAVAVTPNSTKGLTGYAAAVAQAGAIGGQVNEWLVEGYPRPDLVVIESQQVYGRGQTNANNLLPLAGVAIGAAAVLGFPFEFARPADWKGQQKKGPNQRATCRAYGLDHDTKSGNNPVKWVTGYDFGPHLKEVLDALGLALWGATKCSQQFV